MNDSGVINIGRNIPTLLWLSRKWNSLSAAFIYYSPSTIYIPGNNRMNFGNSVRANRHTVMFTPGIHTNKSSVKQVVSRVRNRRIYRSSEITAPRNNDIANSGIIKSASYEG